MARYTAGHKDATRRRMAGAAGPRCKRDGIDGSGIATLMSDAGLTNGAFYAHFASKNDLIATAVTDQLATQYAAIEALPPGRPAPERFGRDYLTPEHRDHPASGCPSAALLDEISRCGNAARRRTRPASAPSSTSSHVLNQDDPDLARDRAIGLFTVPVSTLQLARAVTDRDLPDRILAAGIQNAIARAA
jgi:TetR/AcrR family transcriptional regulator, transcriptional repressor for nem operon